ncbi:MAG: transporter permease [Aeromicrobium sp.]|nr:transporter permease [Aeromicrobium sp.]
MSERQRTNHEAGTAFTGTSTLLRFHLRRDRMMLLWWIAGAFVLYVSQAVSTDGLYTTQAQLDKAAKGMESNAAFIAMAGPARALNTVGGQVAWQAAAFGAIVAGLMSMFLIGRHTRAEEESGRDELVRAAVVGRHAPLAAAALICLIADVLLGGLIAGGLIAYGLPAAGSVALGMAAGLAGLVFGAVTLVGAQLTQSARGAYAITGAVMALSYVLRAVGDIGNGALSWLSPIGWGQYMKAYAGESWWPALISVATVGLLGVLAVRLFDRRDIGSGVLATRPGPARGGSSMHTTLGLAWRLQRASLIGWASGLLLGGLAFGSIGDDVGDLLGDSQFSQDVFGQGGGTLVDSFYGVMALMLALIAAGFAIGSVLRLRGEETDHFAELLLSTAEPRWRWAASHLVIAGLGSIVVIAAGGIGLGVGFALVTGDSSAILRLFGATVQYAVPVLLIGALSWLGYSVRSAWGAFGWAVLGFCFVIMMFGESLQLPDWLMGASPFRHLALVPAEDFRLVPWLLLLMLSAVVGAAGMVVLRRRDLA